MFITTVDATVPLMCRTFRFTHARRLSASASTPAAPNPASGTQRGSEWLLTQQTANNPTRHLVNPQWKPHTAAGALTADVDLG